MPLFGFLLIDQLSGAVIANKLMRLTERCLQITIKRIFAWSIVGIEGKHNGPRVARLFHDRRQLIRLRLTLEVEPDGRPAVSVAITEKGLPPWHPIALARVKHRDIKTLVYIASCLVILTRRHAPDLEISIRVARIGKRDAPPPICLAKEKDDALQNIAISIRCDRQRLRIRGRPPGITRVSLQGHGRRGGEIERKHREYRNIRRGAQVKDDALARLTCRAPHLADMIVDDIRRDEVGICLR